MAHCVCPQLLDGLQPHCKGLYQILSLSTSPLPPILVFSPARGNLKWTFNKEREKIFKKNFSLPIPQLPCFIKQNLPRQGWGICMCVSSLKTKEQVLMCAIKTFPEEIIVYLKETLLLLHRISVLFQFSSIKYSGVQPQSTFLKTWKLSDQVTASQWQRFAMCILLTIINIYWVGTICQRLCLAVYVNFSYLILPKSYEKGTVRYSGCGLGCGWFGAQIQMVIHPSSSPEFPAKEHIHQRISSQVGKKLLILKMSGKVHKGKLLWNRIGEHSRGLRLRRSIPSVYSPSLHLE